MATCSKAKAKIPHPKRLENENRTFGKTFSNLLAQESKTKMALDGIIFFNITHSDRYFFFWMSFCPPGRKLRGIFDDFSTKSCLFLQLKKESYIFCNSI
ncbi:hypothetical protein TNCT_319641 [Trichonephila clavata]|uniref:Uncharacterized protein n=1 Tax=Trichonephila clavata TaxID=2740835 RepID=A0A8X6FWV6_TRICU|nr:hypothetical protein TNCT_319641 [Trichonephila clavata]